MQKKRRVFLVDDHPLVVEWLGNLIGQQSDLVVCGQAGTKSQALERVPKASPGVVIVDISLELDSGIQLIRELKGNLPSLIVLVLSMHDELLYGERALRAGAAGYVMKREATRKILEAIRCVLTGKIYLSPELTSRMAERFVDGTPPVTVPPDQQLSARELEVFEMIGRGLTTRQTAENLRISFKTVQTFHSRIKEKLHLINATELLREATRWHERTRQNQL